MVYIAVIEFKHIYRREKVFMPLTHINDQGRARMVDVSEKAITHRIAVAAGSIYMQPETLQAIID